MASKTVLPEFVQGGESARLIPVVADVCKEQRITSVLLAVFAAVPEFGQHMLRMIGAPVAKTAKILSFTEVVLKVKPGEQARCRPDGLITVAVGARKWSALVEAKIGNADLDVEQVEAYLDLAKEHKIDAVITISNEFAPLPTHHPLQVNRRKLNKVTLFHWSWTALLSEAILLADQKGITDTDQAFILSELIRFLEHPSAGVQAFTRMGPSWKELCSAVQDSAPMNTRTPYVISSVSDWHQLLRYLGLKMSIPLGRSVKVTMSRAHRDDPSKRIVDAVAGVIEDRRLEGELDIPDAASPLKLVADTGRRTITASMRLKPPNDRVRAQSHVTWALAQLKKCEDPDILIRAIWPGRAPDITCRLGALRENPAVILPEVVNSLPVAFEFSRVVDLAGRFKGSSTFVEHMLALAPGFYGDVGQHLRAWVPPAPKVKKTELAAGVVADVIKAVSASSTVELETESV